MQSRAMLTAGVILAGRDKHRAALSIPIYHSSFQEAKRKAAAHSTVAPVLLSPHCWLSIQAVCMQQEPSQESLLASFK